MQVDEALQRDELSALNPEADWVTIVWNDPVNLMSYVSYVFQHHFGYSVERADQLMYRVHNEGKAVVSRGFKERMEADVQAMHGYGLWATLQQVNAS